MAELILLRHGRTDWNLTRRIQGQLDSELDATGHDQAARVAPVIAALGPDVLWSSDSSRARSTAAYVAKETGLEPTYDARLREYHLGPREGLFHHEYEADDPVEYADFVRANWDRVAGAEKAAAVEHRMTEALGELVALVPADGLAVAVSHGAAIRTAVGALLGWPAGQALTVRGLDNCGWVVLQRRASDQPWRMSAYNRTVLA